MKIRLKLFCLICAVSSATSSAITPGVWQGLGPDGASGAVVRFHPTQPDVLFAGTTSGVYRSTDGGLHWNFSGQGMGTPWVSALEIAPSDPAVLYAGTSDHGVYRSTNGGASWAVWSAGLGSLHVDALGIDPGADDVIYLGTSDQAIYKREGQSPWRLVKPATCEGVSSPPSLFPPDDALPGGTIISVQATDTDSFPSVGSVTVDPFDPQTVYATLLAGVFRSLDGGVSWDRFDAGLPTEDGGPDPFVSTSGPGEIAISSADPPGVYLARGGIYRLDSQGVWANLQPFGFPPDTSILAQHVTASPSDPSVLWVSSGLGLLVTQSEGKVWGPVAGSGIAGVSSVAIAPTDPDEVVVGFGDAIRKTHDAGQHWEQIDTGIRARKVAALQFDPFNPSTVYAATQNEVLRWVEAERRWSLVLDQSQAFFPVDGIEDISIDPRSRQFFAATHLGLFQTRLGAGEWQRSLGGSFNVLAEVPGDYDTLYLGARFADLDGGAANLLKSTDGGLSWRNITAGLLGPDSYVDVTSIAVDPSEPSTLYAGTSRGIFKSEDGGGSWSRVRNSLLSVPLCRSDDLTVYETAAVTTLVIDPHSPEVVYAAGSSSGQLLRTVDGGEHWAASSPVEFSGGVRDLAADPVLADTLYAATWGNGILRSADGGATWEGLNQGLDSLFANAVAVTDTELKKLYAGTAGGVYELRTEGVSGSGVSVTQEVSGRLYPTGTIHFEIRIARPTGESNRIGRLAETLPHGLSLLSADASAGEVWADAAINTVLWKGETPAGELIRLDIDARAEKGTEGRQFAAQAVLQSREIGSEGAALQIVSDDPASSDPFDPNRFSIEARRTLEYAAAVPTRLEVAHTFVEAAVANLSGSEQTLALRQFLPSGQPVSESTTLPLGTNGQEAFLVDGGGESPRTLLLESEEPIPAMVSMGDDSLGRLDATLANLEDAGDLYILEGTSLPGIETYVFLFNADTSSQARVTAAWHSRGGELIDTSDLVLEPLGSIQTHLAALFGSVSAEVSDGYLHISSDRPVRGFALRAESESFAIAPAVSPRALDARRIPQVFWDGEGGATRLKVLNPGSRQVRVRMELFPDPSGFGVVDAAESISQEHLVAPGSLDEFEVKSLEPEAGSLHGHLRIGTDSDLSDGRKVVPPLVASVDYDGGSLHGKSSVSVAELAEGRKVSIIQVAHGDGKGIFQGLAIGVPPYGIWLGSVLVDPDFPVPGLRVAVSAYDSRGYPTAAAQITIPFGGRFVGVLDDPRLFGSGFEQSGGHLMVSSSVPVSVVSFYGGPGFLASAPAVIVPADE